MTVQIFIILLVFFSIITSLVTQAVKKVFDERELNYSSNIVVLIIALIVGCVGTVIYYIMTNVPWSTVNIVCIFLMAISNWLGAMVGYDKIIQTISQIKTWRT